MKISSGYPLRPILMAWATLFPINVKLQNRERLIPIIDNYDTKFACNLNLVVNLATEHLTKLDFDQDMSTSNKD